MEKIDLRKSKPSFEDLAYTHVLQAILSHELEGGDRLRPEDLGAALGLSPTPIKLALARLAAEGLVKFQPGKGAYVTLPTVTEIAEVHDASLMCELYALQEGFEHVDGDFLDQIKRLLTQFEAALAALDGSVEAQRRSVEADREFHACIVSLWRNSSVQGWYNQLNARIRSYRRVYILGYRRDAAAAEHLAIYEALERRDPGAAREALRRHSVAARDSFLEQARMVGLA